MTLIDKQPNRETKDKEHQDMAVTTAGTRTMEEASKMRDERDFYTSGPVVFFTWKTNIGEWQVVHVSANVEKILGYLPEEMMSVEMPYGSRMHPEDKHRVMEEAKAFRRARTSHYVQTYRYRHKEGDYRWIDDYNVPVYDEEGNALLIHGYILDITDRYNAEATLKESEHKYRTIVDHINDALIIHDLKGTILEVNQHACNMLGYKQEELIGSNLAAIQYVTDEKKTTAIMKRLKQEGKVVVESIDRHKDGSPIPVEISVNLVSAEGTGIIQSVSRDITERKQAENRLRNSEAQFRQLFEHSPVTLMIHHQDTGEILDANRNAYQTFGLGSLEELKAYDIWLDPPYSLEDAMRWLKKASEEGLQTFEWKNRRADGEIFWEQVHLILIMVNQEQHILAANTNITSLKRAEEALKSTNTKLQAATNAAEAANRAKTQFLANMSHELRTPINGIMGMTQLLKTTPLSEEQMDYADLTLRSCRALTEVVEDILNYTSLERKTEKVMEEPFHLEELLQEVMGLHQATAVQKGLFLNVHKEKNLPNQLIGDRFKLKQILGNLMGNAVKFTKTGGVHLSTKQETVEIQPGRIRIIFQVKDTGIGIPPEKLDYIFQKFSQADESHTRAHGGLGLGLAMAQEQAAMLGGRITVHSTQGKGSIFTLICEMGLGQETVSTVSLPETANICREDKGLAGVQMLVVDDDYTSRLVAQLHLKKMGCQVETAAHGKEALEMVGRNSYHLVLMDCQMPVMNGYEATRYIREREKGTIRHTPIVAMTAKVLPGDREECLEAGMDGFLAKPFDVERLAAIVRKFTCH